MDKYFKDEGATIKGDGEREVNGKCNNDTSGKRYQEDRVSVTDSTSGAARVGGGEHNTSHSECVSSSKELKVPVLETIKGGKPSEVVYHCQVHLKRQ